MGQIWNESNNMVQENEEWENLTRIHGCGFWGGEMSKVNWDKTDWDPLATKKQPLRPKGFGNPKPKSMVTKDEILGIYDQMASGSYESPLDPTPGDPCAAHPPTSRFRVVKDESEEDATNKD
jgi:hypothetical protein